MSQRIIAVDPGTVKSGWVELVDGFNVDNHGESDNTELIEQLRKTGADWLAIEMVASYGMPVGRETFETCTWIGRFIEAARVPYTFVYRKRQGECDSVAMHLCKSNRANDGNIRRALLDRYPATGGGKTPQVGTKKEPGPLYGVSGHVWQALAVGVTWAETFRPVEAEAGNAVLV